MRSAGLTTVWLVLLAGVGLIASGCSSESAGQTRSWTLDSPDGRCQITVELNEEGELDCQVFRAGKLVLPASPLGLRREDQDFTRGLAFLQGTTPVSRREKYDLFAGGAAHVNHVLNGRTTGFRNQNGALLEIELAASNEGVAFRYRFPETNSALHVVHAERTGFSMPLNSKGWLQPYHAAGSYTPAYEDFYFHVSPEDRPPDSRSKARGWAFPALFEVAQADAWVLLTESGTDAAYCGCHLEPDSTKGLYRIAFPFADEHTRGHTNGAGAEPRGSLPWTMPWRVIILGKSAADIALQNLVTDLAAPSRIADTSWIKPGRASWAWWAHPDGPETVALFNEYTDFAHDMGWEYTLFDAGWWKPGLEPIVHHAESKGVMPLAWNFAADFYAPESRQRKLDEMATAGVRGVKVDFWCSDQQEAMSAMQALFKDAAERKLVVNLHGCTLPRGWERTWPNLLTCEAVLGTESYFYESRYTDKAAELNTVLPFTRNAVGPMDSTPVACSPKKYQRTTSAAHELAAAVILRSGLIHYADTPRHFASLPDAVQRAFRKIPAQWDETRCLMGEPGRAVVFTRRSDSSWFIAGLNGTKEVLPVELDLSPYSNFKQRILITEGDDPHMEVSVFPLSNAAAWQHQIPPRGGFIIQLGLGAQTAQRAHD